MGEKERSEDLFREFLSRRESGEDVNPNDYLMEHPELSEELKKLFAKYKKGQSEKTNHKSANEKVPLTIGDFCLVKEIGKGGMGTVYEAEQISLKRKVALKLLPSHLRFSDEAVQKFRREAEAGGRQSHPSIVSIYAVGEHEGIHYIAQELVGGGITLTDKLDDIRDKGEKPSGYFREVARLVSEVAGALQHAHDSGVIHRDIKPSNILLTEEGSPKVTDFGLAKIEDALALSRTGDFAGTPYYMSPEQAMSRRIGIDHRTDIYSLGVSLYEMLCLKRPFEGKTSHDVLKQIVLTDPVDPHKANPRVPRDLSTICLKAMEKLPEKRYQSMAEFSSDLNRFLQGDVILAKPAGVGTRAWKRVKRYPVLSATFAVALLAIISFTGYILFFSYPNIISLRDIAESEKDKAIAAQKDADEQRMIAEKEKDRAEASEQEVKEALLQSEGLHMTARSSLLLSSNPGLSLLLAIEGAKRAPGLFANNALLDALQNCHEKKTLLHDDNVNAVCFSPDSSKVATASDDGSAVIWDKETGKKLITLCKNQRHEVLSISFSPDGTKVVTALKNGFAKIWNAENGNNLFSLGMGDIGWRGYAYTADFSPDNQKVITRGSDHTVRIWNVLTGKEIIKLEGLGDMAYDTRFSPDSRKVVTASRDHTVRIWNSESGDLIRQFGTEEIRNPKGVSQHLIATILGNTKKGHRDDVTCVRFSPDGKKLATGSKDHTVCIWDVSTDDECLKLPHSGQINSVCFSPNGTKIVTASHDETARIWDVSKGDNLHTLRHDDFVYSAVFSPDNDRVLTVSADMTACIWNALTGDLIYRFLGHESAVIAADFSHDGQTVVTASRDHTARIWNVVPGKSIIKLLGHPVCVNTARFSPDGKKVVTSGGFIESRPTLAPGFKRVNSEYDNKDKTARIWDAFSGEQLLSLSDHRGPVVDASFSPDGQKVITTSKPNLAHVWNASTGKQVVKLISYRNASFSPDGQKVVTSGGGTYLGSLCIFSKGSCVNIWDVTAENILVLWEPKGSVWSAKFSPDSKKIVTGLWNGKARIWDAVTGDQLRMLSTSLVSYRGFDLSVSALFSPDGTKIATSSSYGEVQIWDVENSEKPIVTLGKLIDSNNYLQFSPDSKKIIAVSGEVPRLWYVHTGEEITKLIGHQDIVWTAEFSPDGKFIVTASKDQTARVWDAGNGEELMTMRGHEARVNSAFFDPEGVRIVTASSDGTAMIWPVDPLILALRQKPRELTLAEKDKYCIWTDSERDAAPLKHKQTEKSNSSSGRLK